MAMSAAAKYHVRNSGGMRAYRVTNAATIYRNGLVGLKAGYALEWNGTDASIEFLGLALNTVTGNTSASEPPEVQVDCSGATLHRVAVTGVTAITDIDANVYASDGDSFTLTPTTNPNPVAKIVRWFSGTSCDIELLAPSAQGVTVAALVDDSGGAATDGTIEVVTAPTALAATLTDSTGLSGTHDDTLAATTLPAALTVTDGAGTNDGTIPAITTGGAAADQAPVIAAIQELANTTTEHRTLLGVVTQNASDTAQKVIELVTAQAANRTAIIALTDAVAELAAKVNEIAAVK